MYRTADGEEIFIVDGHVHFWDGSPGNQRNRYAEGWVECFYNYHKNLSPAEYVWPLEQYQRYSESQMMKDLFDDGYVDVAIFQPTYLRDFFTNGWNTTEQDAVIKAGKDAQAFYEKKADQVNEEAIKAFKDHKVEVISLSDTEYNAWLAVAKKSSYAKFAKDVPNGQKLIDEALAVK